MSQEGHPLNYQEQRIFAEIMHELEADCTPMDGWYAEARPNPLEDIVRRETQPHDGRIHIPKGHIALQGDFEQK